MYTNKDQTWEIGHFANICNALQSKMRTVRGESAQLRSIFNDLFNRESKMSAGEVHRTPRRPSPPRRSRQGIAPGAG
jgi:hypothetical protein